MERPIRYLRENFVYGRTFVGDADLAEQLERWLERASQRIHQTTKEQPLERFLRDEQHRLRPLAERPYRSLVLLPQKEPRARPLCRTSSVVPRIEVERRPLAVYAAVAGGAR